MSWEEALNQIFGIFAAHGSFPYLDRNKQDDVGHLLIHHIAGHARAVFRRKGMSDDVSEDLASSVITGLVRARRTAEVPAAAVKAYYFTMLTNALNDHLRATLSLPMVNVMESDPGDEHEDDHAAFRGIERGGPPEELQVRQVLQHFSANHPEAYALLSLHADGASNTELTAYRYNVSVRDVTHAQRRATSRALSYAASLLRQHLQD